MISKGHRTLYPTYNFVFLCKDTFNMAGIWLRLSKDWLAKRKISMEIIGAKDEWKLKMHKGEFTLNIL